MKCPECGVANPDSTQFCSNCTAPLISGGIGPQEPTRTYMAPVVELTPGSTFARRYRIIEELEKGGMGRIYKALDTEVSERVALKLIKPEIAADAKTIERFRRELKYARKIGHRNVCRMYDLGREGNNFYITMEYIAGEDLKSFIKRSGRLTIAKAVFLAKQVCGGLSEAHRLGVIHRDLKPKNIMIDTDGNARILDFGIARSLQAEDITRDGAIVGTPEYMSPEQVETKDIDKRSDIYSLGVILFEMLTGRVPFEGETPLGVAMKHKVEKPPNPQKINPQIPDDLNRVILKCLEKKREQRYQTIEEVLTELSAIENELPTTETIVPRRKTRITDEITVTIGLKKLLIPIFGLIAIGILALFIFNPFSKKATIPVPTDRPSLAVMYFRNNTGDESFDHWRSALSDLLITDLSQSPNIRVLSAERLFNILSQLDQVEATAFSSEVIREVGERGGVSSVLVGNYTKANGTFRINASLQDARTGELVASEQLEGEGEKSFYDMVDELTRRVKENFVFTDEEIAKDIDKDVTAITTSSPEAFRRYSEGRRLHLIGHYPQSISEMQAALEIDPDFAMAYRSMASTYANMGFRPASIEALQKAFELSYRTSDRERYIIAGDYYRIQESTFGQAIDAYNQLLELYPEDTTGSTNLGLVYGELEEFEKAAELYRMNIRNKTEGWISRWNLAETYMAMGRYEEARKITEEVGALYPDQARFPSRLAQISVCQGRYDQALEEIERALALDSTILPFATLLRAEIRLLMDDFAGVEEELQNFGESSPGRRYGMVLLSLSQGKLKELRRLVELKPVMEEFLVFLDLFTGHADRALEMLKELLAGTAEDRRFYDGIRVRHAIGIAYVFMGDLDSASKMAEELRRFIESTMNRKVIRFYHHLMGTIEMERRNYNKAIQSFEEAIALLPSPVEQQRYYQPWFFDSLAQAYFRKGDLDKALAEYERIPALTLHRQEAGNFYAGSFYWQGKIHQQEGQRKKALEKYTKFLELWKDADPDIPEVKDARTQLASVK